MKNHIFLFILLISVVFVSCNGLDSKVVMGNGHIEKKTYDYSDFSAIDVSNSVKLYINQGDNYSVMVQTDENLQDKIIISEDDQILSVRNKSSFNLGGSSEIKVYVTLPYLNSLKASGAVEVYTENELKQKERLIITASGASEIDIDVKIAEIEATASGASNIKLKGASKDVKFDASGASSINAIALLTETVDATASGASQLKVFGSVDLKLSATGASGIKYKGGGNIVKVKSSGASSVDEVK